MKNPMVSRPAPWSNGGPGESPESTGSTGADADQELRGFMQLRPFITYNWL